MTAPVARISAIVLDCADEWALGRFWSEVLGRPIDPDSEDGWVKLADGGDGLHLSFQKVDDHEPPTWPSGVPQQIHLDLDVEDLREAEARVTALGATVLSEVHRPDDEPWRVFADPAGHPFCLGASKPY